MAKRFIRVDLNDDARDFRPIAIEPGVPLMDKASAHDGILFQWIGGYAAEPIWEGESASFFARDDLGGRLEEIEVEPIEEGDLKIDEENPENNGPLAGQLIAMRKKLADAKPETPTQRVVKQIAEDNLADILDSDAIRKLDTFFFKYLDAANEWRLVWAWGYERADEEPAQPEMCSNSNCSLLFVKRSKKEEKCPDCQADLFRRKKRVLEPENNRWKQLGWLLFILLALFGLTSFIFWLMPAELVVEPGVAEGPVGAQYDFVVYRKKLFFSDDVTSQVQGIVADPTLAEYFPLQKQAVFYSPGKTSIKFILDDLQADIALKISPPIPPVRLEVEPQVADLTIGSTLRPKVYGIFKGSGGAESRAEITKACDWPAKWDGAVYCNDGFLEGITAGQDNVTVFYRPTPDSPYRSAATIQVKVRGTVKKEDKVASLTATVQAAGDASAGYTINVGKSATFGAKLVTAKDEIEIEGLSSLLEAKIEPVGAARIEGRSIVALTETAGAKLLLKYYPPGETKTVDCEVPLTIAAPVEVSEEFVQPQNLKLVVGQVFDLKLGTNQPTDNIRIKSKDTKIVSITEKGRLVARAPGKVVVTAQQGQFSGKVTVTVEEAEYEAIWFDPVRATVPIDLPTTLKVRARVIPGKQIATVAPLPLAGTPPPVGTTTEGTGAKSAVAKTSAKKAPAKVSAKATYIEVAPQMLKIVQPADLQQYAHVDPSSLTIYGRKTTPIVPRDPKAKSGNVDPNNESAIKLIASFNGVEGSVPVEVVNAPARVALEPAADAKKPFIVPLGQLKAPDVVAIYGTGKRTRIPASSDRLDWRSKQLKGFKDGLELVNGEFAARTKDGGMLEVSVNYVGRDSNAVVAKCGPPEDVTLNILTDGRTMRVVGEQGFVWLRGKNKAGNHVKLIPDMAEFSTSAEDTMSVANTGDDYATGKFEAKAAGKAKLTASHLGGKNKPAVTMDVVAAADCELQFEPVNTSLYVGENSVMKLNLVANGKTEALSNPQSGWVFDPGANLTHDQLTALYGPNPPVTFGNDRPAVANYATPILSGLAESNGPFNITAVFGPLGSSKVAVAEVEVLAPAEPTALKLIPSKTKLAPGQPQKVVLSATIGGKNVVLQANSPLVEWESTTGLRMNVPFGAVNGPGHPTTANATVELPPGAKGDYELTATYMGKSAKAVFSTAKKPKASGAVVTRSPSGIYIPVGMGQQFTVQSKSGANTIPAADVEWTPDFEDAFVRWQAPVLYAKEAGRHVQIEARVGKKRFLLDALTYRPVTSVRPAPPEVVVDPETGEVKIEGPDPSTGDIKVQTRSTLAAEVTVPQGAIFDDFFIKTKKTGRSRWKNVNAPECIVNARKPGTKEISDVITVESGTNRLVAAKVGTAEIVANYRGAYTVVQSLTVKVVPKLAPERLTLNLQGYSAEQPRIIIMPNDYLPLELRGWVKDANKDWAQIGILNNIENAGITWDCDNKSIATIASGMITGIQIGKDQANALATFNKKNVKTPVDVVAMIDGELVINPDELKIGVGESAHLGTQVEVFHGQTNVSTMAEPVIPQIRGVEPLVAWDPVTRSLRGNRLGKGFVLMAARGKTARLPVNVGNLDLTGARVTVKPKNPKIAIDQSIRPQVILRLKDGREANFTDSAIFRGAKTGLTNNAGLLIGDAAGDYPLTVHVPDVKDVGKTTVTVVNDPVTSISIEPASIKAIDGVDSVFNVVGRTAGGLVNNIAPTKLSTSLNPSMGAVIQGNTTLQANSQQGQATLTANYKNHNATAPVTFGGVTEGLMIEPPTIALPPGGTMPVSVVAMTNGIPQALPAGSGAISISNPSVANYNPATGMVTAVGEGQAMLTATYNGQKASASINVAQGIVVDPIYDPTIDPVPPVDPNAINFVPNRLALGVGSPPATFQVLDALGQDVTSQVQLSDAGVSYTRAGNVITPTTAGAGIVTATRGGQTAQLFVDVGTGGGPIGQLIIDPPQMSLMPGETGRIMRVQYSPGGGVPPYPVEFHVNGMGASGVTVMPDRKTIKAGNNNAIANLEVTIADPNGQQMATGYTVTVGTVGPIVDIDLGPGVYGLDIANWSMLANKQFTINLNVAGADGMQFRIVHNGTAGPWATSAGGSATVTSPSIPLGNIDQMYSVNVETKNADGTPGTTIPFSFSGSISFQGSGGGVMPGAVTPPGVMAPPGIGAPSGGPEIADPLIRAL